ncbi:MAG: response regulator [Actinomycetota bacterium]
MKPISIVVVDDHAVVAEALAAHLSLDPDFRVLGTVVDPIQAERVVARIQPDLVLMDVDLGGGRNGIEIGSRLRRSWPGIRIVIVTCHRDPELAIQAMQAELDGWVTKDDPFENLVLAIKAAMAGETFLPPSIVRDILTGLLDQKSEDQALVAILGKLTDREKEILQLMVDGMDRTAISREKFLSPNTVRTHTRNIFAKLNVHSSLEAVGLGLRAGLRPSH